MKERDRKIYASRKRGRTLESIASQYKLTRERVRQICVLGKGWEAVEKARKEQRKLKWQDKDIDVLHLPARVKNVIEKEWGKEDFKLTLGFLHNVPNHVYLDLPNMGVGSLSHLRREIAQFWDTHKKVKKRIIR